MKIIETRKQYRLAAEIIKVIHSNHWRSQFWLSALANYHHYLLRIMRKNAQNAPFSDEKSKIFWGKGLNRIPDLTPFNMPNVKMAPRLRVHSCGENTGYVVVKQTDVLGGPPHRCPMSLLSCQNLITNPTTRSINQLVAVTSHTTSSRVGKWQSTLIKWFIRRRMKVERDDSSPAISHHSGVL